MVKLNLERLKNLARATSKLLVIIFRNSWRLASSHRPEVGQVTEEKRNLGICRQGSIALTPGKVLEQINTVLNPLRHHKLKRNRQLRFARGDHINTKLINLSDKITGFAECGEDVDVTDFDFCKAFETPYHGILLCKGVISLVYDGCIILCTQNYPCFTITFGGHLYKGLAEACFCLIISLRLAWNRMIQRIQLQNRWASWLKAPWMKSL